MLYGYGKNKRNEETDRIAFEAWNTEGTLQRAADKMAEKGILSKQRKPFTLDGVRKAAIRHMVYNYEESKKFLMDTYTNSGYVVEEKYIEQLMIRMAVSALHNPKGIKNWMVDHNLLEKHRKYLSSMVAIPDD